MLHGKEITASTSEVSRTGGPLEDAYMDEFGLSVKLPDQPGERLLFPTIQKCKKGSNDWVEAKAEGQSDHGAKLPAPALRLDGKPPEHAH